MTELDHYARASAMTAAIILARREEILKGALSRIAAANLGKASDIARSALAEAEAMAE